MDSNHRCLGVGQESLPLDHGTILFQNAHELTAPFGRLSPVSYEQAEAVGLEPTIRVWRTPVFETGPSSGRMTSSYWKLRFVSVSCGGWNRTSGLQVQSLASLPAATAPHSNRTTAFGLHPRRSLGGLRCSTSTNCPAVMSAHQSTEFGEKDSNLHRLLQRQEVPTVSRSPSFTIDAQTQFTKCPAGVEPASPAWKAGTFAARPRARIFHAEAVGLEPTNESCSSPVFKTGPSSGRMASVEQTHFQTAAAAGIEPATG